MKTKETTTTAPAFQTPHEQAKAKGKKKPAPATTATAAPNAAAEPKTTKDAWGGRIGTRMSKINVCVISAGKAGMTTTEIAAKSNEAPNLVSAQLSWHVAKGNCTRKEETVDGKKVSRWTVVIKPAAQK